MNEVDPAILKKAQNIVMKYDVISEQVCQGFLTSNGKNTVPVWTQRLALVFARRMYGGEVVDILLANPDNIFEAETKVKHGSESTKS